MDCQCSLWVTRLDLSHPIIISLLLLPPLLCSAISTEWTVEWRLMRLLQRRTQRWLLSCPSCRGSLVISPYLYATLQVCDQASLQGCNLGEEMKNTRRSGGNRGRHWFPRFSSARASAPPPSFLLVLFVMRTLPRHVVCCVWGWGEEKHRFPED